MQSALRKLNDSKRLLLQIRRGLCPPLAREAATFLVRFCSLRVDATRQRPAQQQHDTPVSVSCFSFFYFSLSSRKKRKQKSKKAKKRNNPSSPAVGSTVTYSFADIFLSKDTKQKRKAIAISRRSLPDFYCYCTRVITTTLAAKKGEKKAEYNK